MAIPVGRFGFAVGAKTPAQPKPPHIQAFFLGCEFPPKRQPEHDYRYTTTSSPPYCTLENSAKVIPSCALRGGDRETDRCHGARDDRGAPRECTHFSSHGPSKTSPANRCEPGRKRWQRLWFVSGYVWTRSGTVVSFWGRPCQEEETCRGRKFKDSFPGLSTNKSNQIEPPI
jgi:hypothetical protein